MFYRCLNNYWDYCNGKPTFEGGAPDEKITDGSSASITNRKCTRDYKTCSQRQLFSEIHSSEEKPVRTKAKGKGKKKDGS